VYELPYGGYLYKIVLVGDGGVGKTTIRKAFSGIEFTGSYQMTIGADFAMKTISVKNPVDKTKYTISFQIWDLGGQPHFSEVRRVFYAGARGGLIIYDITDRDTLFNLPMWIKEIQKGVGDIPLVMVGNKIDLRGEMHHVTTDEGLSFRALIKKSYNAPIAFIETSGKTGENVHKAFELLALLIINNEQIHLLQSYIPNGI